MLHKFSETNHNENLNTIQIQTIYFTNKNKLNRIFKTLLPLDDTPTGLNNTV